MEKTSISAQGLNPIVGGYTGTMNSNGSHNSGVGVSNIPGVGTLPGLGYQSGVPLIGGLLGQGGAIPIPGPHPPVAAITAANPFLAPQLVVGAGNHSFPLVYNGMQSIGGQQGQRMEPGEEDASTRQSGSAATQMILQEVSKNRGQGHPSNAIPILTVPPEQPPPQTQTINPGEESSVPAQTTPPQPTLALTPLGLIPILPKTGSTAPTTSTGAEVGTTGVTDAAGVEAGAGAARPQNQSQNSVTPLFQNPAAIQQTLRQAQTAQGLSTSHPNSNPSADTNVSHPGSLLTPYELNCLQGSGPCAISNGRETKAEGLPTDVGSDLLQRVSNTAESNEIRELYEQKEPAADSRMTDMDVFNRKTALGGYLAKAAAAGLPATPSARTRPAATANAAEAAANKGLGLGCDLFKPAAAATTATATATTASTAAATAASTAASTTAATTTATTTAATTTAAAATAATEDPESPTAPGPSEPPEFGATARHASCAGISPHWRANSSIGRAPSGFPALASSSPASAVAVAAVPAVYGGFSLGSGFRAVGCFCPGLHSLIGSGRRVRRCGRYRRETGCERGSPAAVAAASLPATAAAAAAPTAVTVPPAAAAAATAPPEQLDRGRAPCSVGS
ncbi:hypothetical protein OIY81_3020 [Cryptosporidium canis]|nr:hypothetical protein OIY81_3020 [Cryptosporidium canis]